VSIVWAPFQSSRLVMGTIGITAASGGLFGLAVVLPFVVHEFDVSPAIVALVMPAIYIGCFSTSVAGGKAADRWGGARVSALGLVIMSAGVGVASQAGMMAVYLAGGLITGIGYGVVNPSTSVMVDPGSGGGRGMLLGVKQAGVTLGGALSGLLLPVFAMRVGWAVALLGAAVLQMVVGVGILAGPRVSLAGRSRALGEPAEGYRLRPNPGSLYGLTMAGAQITCVGLLVVYLTQDVGLSAVAAGFVFGSVLWVAVVARIVWGVVSDRRPHNRSFPLQMCGALGVLGFAALAVPRPAFVAIAALLIGGGAAAWNGAYLAAVIASADLGEGAAVGRALLLVNLGCIVGPLVASAILVSTDSWVLLWLAMAAVQGLGLIAVTRATSLSSPALV